MAKPVTAIINFFIDQDSFVPLANLSAIYLRLVV
ncbi:hypothetical protein predicted by Glimmer/Critica [Lactiplantibacillus plantarum]|nr:hypothetical protein predicted by Glimmer/Critica [Lactiplantibacillus plantarum]